MSISNAFKLALQKATNIFYDGNTSGLAATDVQGAVDELATGYRLRGAPVVITASQTYTPDAEVDAIVVELVGGGGGGGQNSDQRGVLAVTSPGQVIAQEILTIY